MINNTYKKIKELRQKRGFSQSYMAKELNISRPTYIQIEKGVKDLNTSEIKKCADIFGISPETLMKGGDVSFEIKETEKGKKHEEDLTIRISVPQKNLKKYREVLLYILSKVGSKHNIGESVINKLLYFIDFDYYEKYEEQLIGATYIKNHFGPTPCELKMVVESMKKNGEIEEVKSKFYKFDQKKYFPLRKPNLEILSAREIEHIDDVLNRLSDKNAREIRDYSHGDIPFLVHKDGEKLDYESVFYRDDKYSVRSYDDEL
jgi:transcriptional regulator with XRE-family HTH domain